MGHSLPVKFQLVFKLSVLWTVLLLLSCQDLWAHQDAIVVADQAIVYADQQMSAPVGYVRKGKKIKIGEIPRNQAQVYPILVSGKIAYIRVIDVSTEKESVKSNQLVAERFKKMTKDEHNNNYSFSFFNYSSQISMDKENADLKDKDPVNWYGVSIRGGSQISPKWDFELILNVLRAKAEQESFNSIETGLGGALLVFEKRRLKIKFLSQLLIVPFTSYSISDDSRVNGYGYGVGAGLSASYLLGKNWGLETFGGFYYTQLMGFDLPAPNNSIDPTFLGTRLGAGLNYQY